MVFFMGSIPSRRIPLGNTFFNIRVLGWGLKSSQCLLYSQLSKSTRWHGETMNSKILSVLLLLIVAIGFSGVASAATSQVLVKEAWDELITPEQIIHHDAETHTEEQVVSDPYDIWHNDIYQWIPAVYDIIHHEAVYETVTVVDVPEHFEQVLVSEEYNETVVDVPAHFDEVEANHFGTYLNPSHTQIKNVPHNDRTNYDANKFPIGTVKYGFVVVDDSGCGNNKMWEAVFNKVFVPEVSHVVNHPAVYEDVFVPAVTHEEQVLVQEAYDEQVLVSEEYYGIVAHRDIATVDGWPNDMTGYNEVIRQITEEFPNWSMIAHNIEDVPAVTETIVVVDKEAYDEVIPAVYLHHPAEYKTVEVADPVTPVAPDEVPMQETGGKAVGITAILLVLLVGAGLIAASRRK